MTDDVSAAHAAFRSWMFDSALPFWRGPGHEGDELGACEHLALDGSHGGATFKRMRVQARQIYVFAHAGLLGWPDGERLARAGYRFITRRGELPEGGWVRRLTPDGNGVLDAAVDLYDQAFVLFALAWYARLTRDEEPLHRARRTVAHLHAAMRAAGGGFHNVLPAEPGPRQQNPHMHLLEAALALHETSGETAYRDLADELVELFRRHFLDRATGTLGEFFAPDWAPAPGEAGGHVEPGHHYEWVWLLDQYERLRGGSVGTEIATLYRFARQFGTHPTTAMVFDVVGRQGQIRQASTRLWPQTEALRAHIVMARRNEGARLGEGAFPLIAATTHNVLTRYLAGCPAGAWIDQLDAAGRPTSEKIPTSSLYHLFASFAELDGLVRQRAPANPLTHGATWPRDAAATAPA